MQPNHPQPTDPHFFILAEDTPGLYPFFNSHQLSQHQQQQQQQHTLDFPTTTTVTTTTASVSNNNNNNNNNNNSTTVMQYATPENFVMHENDAIINENIHNQPFVAPNSIRPSQPQQQQTPQQPSQPPPQQQQNHHVSSGVDFRRRRNWSERILNEVTGLLHVLSPVGKILHCSPSCIELTGYTPEELVGRSLTEFLHVDDIDIFIREFNRAFHTRSQIKTIYRFRKKDQSYTLFETIGHPRTDVLGQPPRSFFAISQPYPSAMDSLFDSFLELKMENEWLKQRLREIPVDVSIDPIFNIDVTSGSNSSNNSTTTVASNNNRNINTALSGCQQPMGGYNNNNLKRGVPEENITSASNTTNNSNSNNNNNTSNGLWLQEDAMMNVYANNKNKNTPNSGNNNRSRSPVPPTTSSAGGAATAVAAVGMVSANVMDITETTAGEMIKDKSKRRKKQRGADEYVCTDCGTATSPEWRKGPHGPKTLCNACGLRFAKKSKKNRS